MESGNDYVIQVKRNQKILHNNIKELSENREATDTFISTESNRGRQETRQVKVYNLRSADESSFELWSEIKTVIYVHRYGIRKNKKYSKHHYYISSLEDKNAQTYATGIRNHWSIENKLHWVKDVTLGEDKNLIITGSIARNISLIKSIMINVFRLNGFKSIKYAMEEFANRPLKASLLINGLYNY